MYLILILINLYCNNNFYMQRCHWETLKRSWKLAIFLKESVNFKNKLTKGLKRIVPDTRTQFTEIRKFCATSRKCHRCTFHYNLGQRYISHCLWLVKKYNMHISDQLACSSQEFKPNLPMGSMDGTYFDCIIFYYE